MIIWCWLAEHTCYPETHRFWVWSKRGNRSFILTSKKINMQQSIAFWFKGKRNFSSKTVSISKQKMNNWDGLTELHGCQTQWKLISSFCFGRLISMTGYLIGVKKNNNVNFFGTLSFSRWKGECWIREVITARLVTFLRLSSIDEVVLLRCKLRKTG